MSNRRDRARAGPMGCDVAGASSPVIAYGGALRSRLDEPRPSVARRLTRRRPLWAVSGVPGLQIHDAPRWLPHFHGSPRLDGLTLGVRLRAARAALLSKGVRRVVLYLWRPDYATALGLVPHDLSCYHMDDEYLIFADRSGRG